MRYRKFCRTLAKSHQKSQKRIKRHIKALTGFVKTLKKEKYKPEVLAAAREDIGWWKKQLRWHGKKVKDYRKCK